MQKDFLTSSPVINHDNKIGPEKQLMDDNSRIAAEKEQQKSKNIFNYFAFFAIGVLAGGLIVYGWLNSNKFGKVAGEVSDSSAAASYLKFKEVKAAFVPTGVPDVYGQELGISFDKVQEAINKVRVFGPTYGTEDQKIILTGADLERYINIGFQIACEYCCGVETLVFEDGSAACGCAHSIMMRGLTAYLIQNHPELSNDWILEELTKWKRTYFPKQTLSAELDKRVKAGETGIKEVMEEFPDLMPQMVGGC